MSKLPKLTIKDQIDSITFESLPRPHLGGSIIGSKCTRYVAYHFWWTYKSKHEARVERIFRLGDAIESQIVNALESIDIAVKTQVPVPSDNGHAGGTADGILTNVPGFDEPILFEAKSMNHQNYLDVQKNGVQKSKPVYYSQMQMYMGRLNLAFGLYVAMNKNNSELYLEMLPFDTIHYTELVDKEMSVLTMENINQFPRISTFSNWHECKWCNAQGTCHHNELVEENCRTCEYVEIQEDGEWVCLQSQCLLSTEAQVTGCGLYKLGSKWK